MSRITLSPWSRDALDPDALADLEDRAADLDVHVSTVKRTKAPAGWVIRVRRGEDYTELRSPGVLAEMIDLALDRFEAEHTPYPEPDRRSWTTDELVVIAAQSGLDVTRA